MRGSGRVAKSKKERPSINYIYPDLVDQAIREKYPAMERLQQPQSVASPNLQKQSSFADNQVLSSTTSSSSPNFASKRNKYNPLLPDDPKDVFNSPASTEDDLRAWSPWLCGMQTPSETVEETKLHENMCSDECDLLHASTFPDCDKVDEVSILDQYIL